MNDRSDRTAILEPIMLILKSRKGIAGIIAILVSSFMLVNGYSVAEIVAITSPIYAFIGGQSLIDASETSTKRIQELNEMRDEILDVVGVLLGDFEEEDNESNLS